MELTVVEEGTGWCGACQLVTVVAPPSCKKLETDDNFALNQMEVTEVEETAVAPPSCKTRQSEAWNHQCEAVNQVEVFVVEEGTGCCGAHQLATAVAPPSCRTIKSRG
jgi:hypothetical protein